MNLNIHPKGHRILVKPIKIEKKTAGGIVLIDETVDSEQRATTKGKVLAIGELAWKDFHSPEPWAEIGDIVIFKAHQGMRLKNDEEDEEFLLLLNDADVAAVFKETPNG